MHPKLISFFNWFFRRRKTDAVASEYSAGTADRPIRTSVKNADDCLSLSGTLEEVKSNIDFLIPQLNYVGKNLEIQWEKRAEAFEKLEVLGSAAEPAIPVLLRKLFSHYPRERQMAEKVLEATNINWAQSERIGADEIAYLVGRLKGDRTEIGKASRILQRIGEPTVPFLFAALESGHDLDPPNKAELIRVLGKINPDGEKFPNLIRSWMMEEQDLTVLEACAEAVYALGMADEGTTLFLRGLIIQGSESGRFKALLALEAAGEYLNRLLPDLFRLLADPVPEIRGCVVDLLAKHDFPGAAEFYREVVLNKGLPRDEDYEAVFKKLKFWISNSGVESFRSSKQNLWDSLSWYNLELRKQLAQPEQLLESVLQILARKGTVDPELKDTLIEIFETSETPSIKAICINLLGSCVKYADQIMPFLIDQLGHSSELIRSEVNRALSRLDQSWIERPESVELLDRVIARLDQIADLQAKETILSIGAPVIPLLAQHLRQTEKRVMQQTIIRVLGKFGSFAEITLPVLLEVKAKCQNTHTIQAINELIAGFEVEE